MKYLLFLLIAALFAAMPVLSQTSKKSPAKTKTNFPAARSAQPRRAGGRTSASAAQSAKPRQKLSSDVLKETAIGKWGVMSLSIPEDLIAKDNSTGDKTFGKLSWKNHYRLWTQPFATVSWGLRIDLRVMNWNNPIKDLALVKTDETITPEFLIEQELSGDEYAKKQPDSMMKETGALEIDNQRGAFYRAESRTAKGNFLLGWTTYRYYQGKPQSVYLTILGGEGELEKALKILQSLKLQRED